MTEYIRLTPKRRINFHPVKVHIVSRAAYATLCGRRLRSWWREADSTNNDICDDCQRIYQRKETNYGQTCA